MRFPKFIGEGTIDARRSRRHLYRYIKLWRAAGRRTGWPDHPVTLHPHTQSVARLSPAALVRKFRNDIYDTKRQRNWVKRIKREQRRVLGTKK